MLLSLYKLFCFFLPFFLSSFIVRPRSGTTVVSQCARKECYIVLFFPPEKRQILVYLEFILGSLSSSDAQVLCVSAIFDPLSSVSSFFWYFSTLFSLLPLYINFQLISLFFLLPPFLSTFLFLSSYIHGLAWASPELCEPRNVIVTATDTPVLHKDVF